MTRVDLGNGHDSVGDVIRGLGPIRAPVELVLDGEIVAKLIPPTELSEREKQQAFDEGWQIVEKARARSARLSAAQIRREVGRAVRDVRARHDHGGR